MTTVNVRPAAVAGSFYPRSRADLAGVVDRLLSDAVTHPGGAPKALVVPHAGYVYSGPVAASAYAQWRGLEPGARIVLLGPAHYVGIRGLALPDADALETPLGRVQIDPLAASLGVPVSALVHAREHSLEVQLPFLQSVLGPHFTLVPIAVGHADRHEVARVLDAAWERSHVIISSDLSHFLPWAEAQALDAKTAQSIVSLDADAIGDDQACGNAALRGFLDVAKRRGLVARQLDLRTSGDTAGDKDRVVGYGAFSFHEGAHA
ncbi:MAG: AmmeMemoRadiSam system protein B [Myxococcaceae bacterium]|nr:AmmeMemoRadiSam system protein B [Myxococcaceae bacterium]